MGLPFFIVDVFAERPFSGNQLAVFIDPYGLPPETMQDIAREMHFSETTFVNPSPVKIDTYQVRIFTPEHEVPFAGHPTLGTACIIRDNLIKKQVPVITLSLEIGEISVTFDPSPDTGSFAWMKQQSPEFRGVFHPDEIAPVLSLPLESFDTRFPIQEVSTGLPFILVPLSSLDTVRRAKINHEAYEKLIHQTSAKALFIFCDEPINLSNMIHARMFGDYYGVPEDPATGSASGCLAGYITRYQYFRESPDIIRVEQGYEINRPSLLYLRSKLIANQIVVEVGGQVILIGNGEFRYRSGNP